MDYLVIDKSQMKVLLSETRIDILKHLAKRRYTITELSTIINTTKSNIADHLDKLEEAQLVEQIDEGRKWKYYNLTVQGRELIDGKSIAKPIAIILVSLVLMAGIALNILFTISESARLAAIQQVDSELTFIPKFDIFVMVVIEIVLFFIVIWAIFDFLRARSKMQ